MTTKLIIICDVCKGETTVERDWNDAKTSMEYTEVLAGTVSKGMSDWPLRVTVKLPQGQHVCKYCVIKAVAALDDRPKSAAGFRSTLLDIEPFGMHGSHHTRNCPECSARPGTAHTVGCLAANSLYVGVQDV